MTTMMMKLSTIRLNLDLVDKSADYEEGFVGERHGKKKVHGRVNECFLGQRRQLGWLVLG